MKRKNEDGAYWVMMRAHDKQTCEWGLEMMGGNVRAAAEFLGLNVGYLHKKIKDLGIDVAQFRNKPEADEAASAAEA
jgi:DNA-binding NtrC family response regulator